MDKYVIVNYSWYILFDGKEFDFRDDAIKFLTKELGEKLEKEINNLIYVEPKSTYNLIEKYRNK